MAETRYNWKRYWCPREGCFNLSDGGYLVEPEGEYGRILAQDVRPYADIASSPCLILLGEPGIGKTTALEEIADAEAAEHQALSLDLGEYSSDDRLYRQFFEADVVQEWVSGSGVLSILLDSLDECRIDSIAKILSRELSRLPLQRMRLRIACRTAEWPITLEEALRSAWGKDSVAVYELAPLTRANVIDAVTTLGLASDRFLDEIARIRAQPLAIKPISLNLLLRQFQSSSALPPDENSLYMKGCYCLCEDSQERRDAGMPHACDAAHRFAVAQRIAYLSIFSGKFAVWTGPQDGSMPADDLSLLDCTGKERCCESEFDVTEDILRDTLNTGLFTARGAHRMGWAHQTYGEFLAAQYIVTHLDAKQRRSLLLLRDAVGADVVPQLSEVAARVATCDEQLFEEMLDTAPNVLLRSDVATADYEQRASLLSSILSKCDTGDIHFRDVDQADRLRHLNHPEIGEQLKPFVTQNTFGLHARVLALDTLEACGTDDLKEELLALAVDEDADIELRCRALGVLCERVDDNVAEVLRPFAEDRPADPDRRVKGYILRALWPEYLSAAELFQLVTAKERNRLTCAYDMFLSHELIDGLRPEDMPAALVWAQAQGRRHDLDFQFQRLLDGILIKAWDMLHEEGVLSPLADALGKRLTADHGHIMDGSNFEKTDFLSDDSKRRRLLSEMVSRINDLDDGTFYLSSRCANIAKPADFVWLVKCATSSATEEEAKVWARLCRWNYNIGQASDTDAILSVFGDNAALHEEFAPLLDPIELDSEEARKLKEDYEKYSKYDRKREEPPLLDPPPAVRIQQLLERCERGESRLWWCVARELTLEPRSTHYNEMWEPDITTTPGWQDANEETRTRIRETAKLYILENSDIREEWVNKGSTIMYPANAGYQALRLVHASDPTFIATVSADAWARWAVALLYHPLNVSEEESSGFHQHFVSRMFAVAPTAATEALEMVIVRESKQSGFLSVLSRVEHVQCPQLADMLKTLISEKKLVGSGAARVLSCLLAQQDPHTTEWVLNLMPSPLPADGLDREYALGAAEALCSPATQDTWLTVWSAMNDDHEFGRNVVGRLASFYRSESHPLSGLTDQQLSDLYVWVSREFPHRDDPDVEGAHTVSKREEIAHWRDQYLLQLLKNRGTVSACNAISRMIPQLPELPWLRLTWLEAVKTMRSQTWQPLEPSHLLKLEATTNARAVLNSEELLRVIQESLDRLQDQLRGQTPLVKHLWDYQRDKKSWCPKDENSLSDFVANHLRRELRENGIVVNREVEIRPLRGTSPGQETDILVEAVPPGGTNLAGEPIQVVIETKGCWNAGLETDMQEQLVQRYLQENQCDHGVYLVGYFRCASWDDTDYRKRACSKELDELTSLMEAQASSLSADGNRISARIIDVRLD